MEPDKSWEAVLDPGKATDDFATPGDAPRFDPTRSHWDPEQGWCGELSCAIDRREEFLTSAALSELQLFDAGSTQAAIVLARHASGTKRSGKRGKGRCTASSTKMIRAYPAARPPGLRTRR